MEQKSIERTCEICGKRFYLQNVRSAIGRIFYVNSYDEFFPEGNICIDCAEVKKGEFWYDFSK